MRYFIRRTNDRILSIAEGYEESDIEAFNNRGRSLMIVETSDLGDLEVTYDAQGPSGGKLHGIKYSWDGSAAVDESQSIYAGWLKGLRKQCNEAIRVAARDAGLDEDGVKSELVDAMNTDPDNIPTQVSDDWTAFKAIRDTEKAKFTADIDAVKALIV